MLPRTGLEGPPAPDHSAQHRAVHSLSSTVSQSARTQRALDVRDAIVPTEINLFVIPRSMRSILQAFFPGDGVRSKTRQSLKELIVVGHHHATFTCRENLDRMKLNVASRCAIADRRLCVLGTNRMRVPTANPYRSASFAIALSSHGCPEK